MNKHTTTFKGFPPEAFKFLAGLAKNNNKKWFDSHREDYDEAVLGPALLFVEMMGEALGKIAGGVAGEPRVGGSLFRIHKDTRFSKDKKPYKTHVGIRLRDPEAVKSSACTGPLFYVEFDAKKLRLGAGVKAFDKEMLDVYRQGVAQGDLAKPLSRIVRSAQGKGHVLIGEVLKRIPPAYADQVDNDLIKRKGLFIMQEQALPDVIHKPGFVAYCARWFKGYVPLYKQLDHLRHEVTG